MYYYLIRTNEGWVGIAGAGKKIAILEFPKPTREEAEALIIERSGVDSESASDFSGMADSIAAYFSGEKVDFDSPIDYGSAGEFDVSVWKAAREIPYGEVRSYAWVAERIGRPNSARAVGQALGRNPVPIIVPCHRVIRSNGDLGGFSYDLDWKRRLLEKESKSK